MEKSGSRKRIPEILRFSEGFGRGLAGILGISTVVIAAGLCWVLFIPQQSEIPKAPPPPASTPAFTGNARELQATEVTATLDAPIPKDKNVVWCASFLAAWKTMENELGTVLVSGSPLAESLNRAPDPRPNIPNASLCVATGEAGLDLTKRIAEEFARKFPGAEPPDFSGVPPGSFIAYAHLEASARFSIPYFQFRKPLVFLDSSGRKTKVNSFGVPPERKSQFFQLRQQPKILFARLDKNGFAGECVIDLDRNSPDQIVVARVKPAATLAGTIEHVEHLIRQTSKPAPDSNDGLSHNDVLLVPDIVWRISRRFTELEGRRISSSKRNKLPLATARQDIRFRLTRTGAELRSDADVVVFSIPTRYLFNEPFLLYMKTRSAKAPYFAMWIDNAELLCKWKKTTKTPHPSD